MIFQHLMAMHEPFAITYLTAIANITAEEKTLAAEKFAIHEPVPIHRVEGTTGIIEIRGVLSRSGPGAWDLFFGFGGTSYLEIISAANQYEDDESIESVELRMDTPGGNVIGLDEAYQAIAELAKAKPVIGINEAMIASAGYYIACGATEIHAVSPAAETGSIGVRMAGYDYTKYEDELGIKWRVMLSEFAPNKDYTVETKIGRATIQANLDAHERLFHQRVSEGRGKDVEFIRENFGQGALLIAKDPGGNADALSVGMIDKMLGRGFDTSEPGQTSHTSAVSTAGDKKRGQPSAEKQETQHVSKLLKELLADNPNARVEYDAAVADATKQGKENGAAKVQARFEKISKFVAKALDASNAYGKVVTDLAAQVMSGDAELSELKSAMATVDVIHEHQKSSIAAGETTVLGATGGETSETGSVDGVAKTESDLEAQLAASKKSRGG